MYTPACMTGEEPVNFHDQKLMELWQTYMLFTVLFTMWDTVLMYAPH